MLRQFLMDEYIGGPTGVDHPAIDGIFMVRISLELQHHFNPRQV